MTDLTDLNVNIEKLVKQAGFEGILAKGLHEVCKALEANYSKDGKETKAALCILATDCQEEKYKHLISSLCKQYKVPLLSVASRKELGQMVGLHKLDPTGAARKVRGCSSVVVKIVPENEEAKAAFGIVKSHAK